MEELQIYKKTIIHSKFVMYLLHISKILCIFVVFNKTRK
ncbi:putative membrane protein [Bacteroides uniformis str. 3978 T3 i]|uniref:Putative membrane protein n=1 Tax=Bacteroides uniformis str. 3978 T3 ii TaxID=1339349 RepID=A0A078S1T2_BACUN|nr:putative membrane protein [Bacteroides uniformis str. 3978 T3 ii]KDS58974.1 putative membrane protein [Bacteroides uniformis str. 3978 T3 i]